MQYTTIRKHTHAIPLKCLYSIPNHTHAKQNYTKPYPCNTIPYQTKPYGNMNSVYHPKCIPHPCSSISKKHTIPYPCNTLTIPNGNIVWPITSHKLRLSRCGSCRSGLAGQIQIDTEIQKQIQIQIDTEIRSKYRHKCKYNADLDQHDRWLVPPKMA